MKHGKGHPALPMGILFCLLALCSHGSAQTQAPAGSVQIPAIGGKGDLAKELTGEWRNQYLRVRMHTYNNRDTTITVEADTSNWEAKLHIKPIRTHFLADGSYYSEYRNLRDSVVMRPSGTWRIDGDSLRMEQTIPEAAVYTFHLSIRDHIASFSGLIDFDGDGKRDDEYFGVQKKQR